MTDNERGLEGYYPVAHVSTSVNPDRNITVKYPSPYRERTCREGSDTFNVDFLVDDDTYYDMVDDDGYYHGDIRIYMARHHPQPVIDLSYLKAEESSDDADDEGSADGILEERRFMEAFCAAMKSISARPKKSTYESTSSLCYRLNYEYKLDGNLVLREEALEQASHARAAFASSKLKSPR